MLALKLLDIATEIIFLENDVLPIHSSLKSFVVPANEFARDGCLHINLVADPFKINDSVQPVKFRDSSIAMFDTGYGALFTYPIGQFIANRNFTQVQLWSPYDRQISLRRDGVPSFDGNPGLRVILWARATIEGYCYLHGALNVIDGKYVVFLGDSGVGKTTLSNLACDCGGTCLTEEDPFMAWKDKVPIVHGTPWPGPKGPDVPKSGELAALFFLRHADENRVQRINHALASRRLLHNSRIFKWLPKEIPKAIELLDTVAQSVPAYDFSFVPNHSAIEELRKVL